MASNTPFVAHAHKELECPLCLELFDKPVYLHCSHCICAKHTRELVINNQISCPICRSVTELKADNNNNNATPLPVNYIAQSLVEALKDEQTQSICGECEAQSKALHHCKNCDILMCDACLEKTHTQSTSKAIQKHQIAPTRAVTSKQVSKNLMCAEHEEPLKYYCTQDKLLVCRDCLTLPKCSHKDHAYVTIKEASADVRKEISNLLAEVTAKQAEFTKLLELVKNTLKEVNQNDQQSDIQLQEFVSQLLALIQTRKQQLEQEKASVVQRKKNNLEKQQAKLQSIINNLTMASSYCQKICDSESDMDIFHAQHKLKQQLQVVDDMGMPAELCESSQFSFQFESKQSQLDAIQSLFQFTSDDTTTPLSSPVTKLGKLVPANSDIEEKTGQGCDLIVTNKVVLAADQVHYYEKVKVTNGGVLTVQHWDGTRGGRLMVIAKNSIIIEKGGKIDVTARGFRGGIPVAQGLEGQSYGGESTALGSIAAVSPNQGGGGGGRQSVSFGSVGGGGGGYGTYGIAAEVNRHDGRINDGGRGGITYGSSDLCVMHLGSGGGAGAPYATGGNKGRGGNGGGVLFLLAPQIRIDGEIVANGEDGEDALQQSLGSGGGGGSGGSIYLCANVVVGTGAIAAKGGKAGQALQPSAANVSTAGGTGGDGRIRIDAKKFEVASVAPAPALTFKSEVGVPNLFSWKPL